MFNLKMEKGELHDNLYITDKYIKQTFNRGT